MNPVQIVAFLNSFAEPRRLDVVVDWGDDWPVMDPLASAVFKLARTPAGGGTPVEPPPTAFDLALSEIFIPQVREQLVAVGLDADDPAVQRDNVAKLAPGFVGDVAVTITGAAPATPAKQALSMKDFTRDPHLQFFGAANFLGDLKRWVRSEPPWTRAWKRAEGSGAQTIRQRLLDSKTKIQGEGNQLSTAIQRVIDDVNEHPGLGQGKSFDFTSVTAHAASFRSLVQAARGADVSLVDLERQIRLRAIGEHLAYAEALRRHSFYSRVRSETNENDHPAMTATGSDDELRRDRRADVRRVARDEAVIGSMFHVLHWFAWPRDADVRSWDGSFLWVRPFVNGSALSDYAPKPTLIGLDAAGRPVTVLRRDKQPTYFVQAVNVRQVAPALLLDDSIEVGEPTDPTAQYDPGKPKNPAARLARMAETGQSCPEFTKDAVGDAGNAAFALNDLAHDPPAPSKEGDLINSDMVRELTDAGESVRRNAPPHDTIAITWERELVESIVNGTGAPAYHAGFKGYRIDVRQAGDGGRWHSLCTVEREIFDRNQQAVVRSRLPREGYVVQPLQNHSADKDALPTVLTMPADFVHWAGGSVVVAAPLDRLGESLAPPATDGALLVMRELGTTRVNPRYGRTYEFRVRGVGLSGVGPNAALGDDDGAHDAVEFRRGVPLNAPAVNADYVHFVPLDDGGNPIPLGSEGGATPKPKAPDAPLLALSSTARLEVETSLPLAHWRVALHARGLTAAEQTVNGGAAFERACARLVARVRQNWRRRNAGMQDAEALRQSAHLSCVDPHCGAIEVVTLTWYPFSKPHNDRPDRHLVIGREVHERHDIDCASFSELVVRGEAIVDPPPEDHRRGTDQEGMDDRFTVVLDDSTLPARATPEAAPRMLAGFHCIAEVSAQWPHDAITHFPKGEGRRRWTRHLFAGIVENRPIGGAVTPLHRTLNAGGPLLKIGSSVFADAAYAAIADLENERNLVMLPPLQPQPPPSPPPCDTSAQPPHHARPVQWRKIFFDQDCAAQPPTAVCLDKRKIYRQFVAQQLGEADGATVFPTWDDDHERLAVRLTPHLVPQAKRSLVFPVFTFPNATTSEVTKPKHPCDDLFVISTIGVFGSADVSDIFIDSGGSGYKKETTEVVVRDPGGADGIDRGIRAVVDEVDAQGSITKIKLTARGHDVQAPTIVFKSGSGTGAAAHVNLATAVQRRLPWVDLDIIWIVRLAWCVPLENSGIERPLELAAVREFRLFRRDLRANQPGNPCVKQPSCDPYDAETAGTPLATLARPGVDTLQCIDLDQVEFTWIDGITDREAHLYEYCVVAIPEDRHTFAPQVWYSLRVDVPDSSIAARPESARFLPMLAQNQGSSHLARNLAIYFSDPAVRQSADHLTIRYGPAADDPMLTIGPKVKVDPSVGPVPPFVPTTWEQVFPSQRVPVTRADNFAALRQLRGDLDGVLAPEVDCSQPAADRRSRLFVAKSRTEEATFICPDLGQELGNPFFKLRLQVFDDNRFPALAHTAASEPAESEWLQFYPDDLRWSDDTDLLKIASPWGGGVPGDDNFVWYRYHFFAEATETMLFHVSTFYSQLSQLVLDASQRAAVSSSLQRFGSQLQPQLRLFVRAEEGLLAETYGIAEAKDTLNTLTAQIDPAHRFVVLRSTPELKEVLLPAS